MRKVSARALLVCILILSTSMICTGATVSFQGLGDIPGGSVYSQASGISGDGSVAVGYSSSTSGNQAYRWTQEVGMVGIGYLYGYSTSNAYAASTHGSRIVGTNSNTSGSVPYLWSSATGMVQLGGYGAAVDISADGLAVAGTDTPLFPSGNQPWRWTEMTGKVYLGHLPGGSSTNAVSISADGSVIVGYGTSSASSHREAFYWTQATGMSGLGFLPNDGYSTSYAHAVSGDGSVVVGYSTSGEWYEAFRWTNATGMVGLGYLPGGDTWSMAHDVSSDGSVIVGWSQWPRQGKEAMVWDEHTGMRCISDLLVNSGLDMTGWLLTEATGVSDNGFTIVGFGTNPDGFTEGWIAVIPEPATLGLLLIGGLALFRRKLK